MAWSPLAVTARSAVLASFAVAGGCVSILDPDHCANAKTPICGDMTCSRCVAENHGCVQEESDPSCQVEVEGGSGSTGGSESGSESGPAVDCVGEGMVAECPEESAPYCVDGTCSRCIDDDFCAALDPGAPVCDESGSLCVGCTEHAHCPGSACDLAVGECMVGAEPVWVHADADCGGFGVEDDPYCSFTEALGARGDPLIIHIVAATADVADTLLLDDPATPRTIAVLGEANARLGGDPVVSVASQSRVYLSGVYLKDSTIEGVLCDGSAEIWLDDAQVGGSVGPAIDATNCDIVVRRSEITGNPGGGIISSGGSLRILSGVVGGNGVAMADTVGLSATTTILDLRYATIVNNRGMTTDVNFTCTNASGSVRNSILLGDAPSVACAEVMFSGSYSDVVLGGDNMSGAYNSEYFVMPETDYHLSADAGVLMGVAHWEPGDPRFDLDGMPRGGVSGQADWAGADVP